MYIYTITIYLYVPLSVVSCQLSTSTCLQVAHHHLAFTRYSFTLRLLCTSWTSTDHYLRYLHCRVVCPHDCTNYCYCCAIYDRPPRARRPPFTFICMPYTI